MDVSRDALRLVYWCCSTRWTRWNISHWRNRTIQTDDTTLYTGNNCSLLMSATPIVYWPRVPMCQCALKNMQCYCSLHQMCDRMCCPVFKLRHGWRLVNYVLLTYTRTILSIICNDTPQWNPPTTVLQTHPTLNV